MLSYVDIISQDCIGPHRSLQQMSAGPSIKSSDHIKDYVAANERREEAMGRSIVDLIRGTYTGRACKRVLAVVGASVARILPMLWHKPYGMHAPGPSRGPARRPPASGPGEWGAC